MTATAAHNLQSFAASGRAIDPLTRVTKENVKEFGKNWDKWLGK